MGSVFRYANSIETMAVTESIEMQGETGGAFVKLLPSRQSGGNRELTLVALD
jgi:hypothetical protein